MESDTNTNLNTELNTKLNTELNTNPNTDKKKVTIIGTSNRYQIKKLTKQPKEIKRRKAINKATILNDCFSEENQIILINELYRKLDLTDLNDNKVDNYDFIKTEMNKKLSNYKQQDIIRKLFDPDKFIDLFTISTKLYECNGQCYYCKEKMIILYELVREMKQWTVDRINNDLGHNKDNIVLACLECNLKRRRIGKDAFLFTKQLNIVRSDFN